VIYLPVQNLTILSIKVYKEDSNIFFGVEIQLVTIAWKIYVTLRLRVVYLESFIINNSRNSVNILGYKSNSSLIMNIFYCSY